MRILGENLGCERGGRLVFEGLNFTAASGQMLVLRGPNGAGKTSLLRLLAGLGEPAGGRLAVDGAPEHARLPQMCHFVAHQDAVKPHLTVRENLSFWRHFFGRGDVNAALEAVNLAALAPFQARRLSAGQKRRLSLARLALVERPVWLLDEPTVGLDTPSQDLLACLMTRHLTAGGIIIAATHIELPVSAAGVLNFAGAAP